MPSFSDLASLSNLPQIEEDLRRDTSSLYLHFIEFKSEPESSIPVLGSNYSLPIKGKRVETCPENLSALILSQGQFIIQKSPYPEKSKKHGLIYVSSKSDKEVLNLAQEFLDVNNPQLRVKYEFYLDILEGFKISRTPFILIKSESAWKDLGLYVSPKSKNKRKVLILDLFPYWDSGIFLMENKGVNRVKYSRSNLETLDFFPEKGFKHFSKIVFHGIESDEDWVMPLAKRLLVNTFKQYSPLMGLLNNPEI